MFPVRLTLMTYNLWNVMRWPERKAALQQFFELYQPDIIALQELRIETRTALDEALPGYRRVVDDFRGWEVESNLYWNDALLTEMEHGVEDIGIRSDEYRGLFWSRLQVRATGHSLVVGTPHYTYQGHPDELSTGFSPRLEQARQTAAALDRLGRESEPVFFMGDLNDPVLPTILLRESNYHSCFARLGLLPPPTWPSLPTADMRPLSDLTNQTIDWIVSNQHARPLVALVPHFFLETIAPSDHWPVLALYEI